jgi:serine/threonine protein kinase
VKPPQEPALPVPVALRPGRQVDGLRVEEWLGSGGASEVYRVRDPRTGEAFALKIATRARARAIAREAEALRGLEHPAFVRVLGASEVHGWPTLLLECIDGPHLGRWVQLARPSLAELATALDAVADAIAHAHDRGWVHRDLKPSNALLHRAADGWVLRVTDLGLAHRGDGPTELGGGTPAYTAPERLRGEAGDARADVFALGCLTYALLTGAPPFRGADRLAVWNAIVGGAWRPLAVTRPDLDPAWHALVAACLSPDPEDRPPDARAFGAALAACPPGGRPVPLRAGLEREDWADDRERAARSAWLHGDETTAPGRGGGEGQRLSSIETPAPAELRRALAGVAGPVDPRATTALRAPLRGSSPPRRRRLAVALAAALALALAGALTWALT